ncbi:hypothetical protein [Mesorhizobium sp. Z1-4]|uniref:hypothetical protein n=1 Tax=Mesorhizobium sp. Z1-4 TaxID=2448478 RepID=UPI000FD8BBB6|nr:hypothetical protein [Mesorhizobium sp. Z1-4]
MTPEERDRLAAEAARLMDNEAFQWALASIRSDALEGLVSTPATDTDTIRDRQTKVKVADEFLDLIEAAIRDGQPRKAAGIV